MSKDGIITILLWFCSAAIVVRWAPWDWLVGWVVCGCLYGASYPHVRRLLDGDGGRQ